MYGHANWINLRTTTLKILKVIPHLSSDFLLGHVGSQFFGTNPGDFLATPRETPGSEMVRTPQTSSTMIGAVYRQNCPLLAATDAKHAQPKWETRAGGWLIANTLPLGPRKYVLGPSWEAYAIVRDNNGPRFIRWVTKAHVYPNASFSKTEWRNWSKIALPNIRPCKSYTKWTSQRKTLPRSWTHELDMTSEL